MKNVYNKTKAAELLIELPRFDSRAYRVDYGPPYNINTTAYDVVVYEEKCLGNENNIPSAILPYLKKLPASSLVWVTKNKNDAKVYGHNIQEIILENESRIIGNDEMGGFLVLRGEFLKFMV